MVTISLLMIPVDHPRTRTCLTQETKTMQTQQTKQTTTLTPTLLHKMDAYWRAANYLSVGQIYLYDNPL